MTTKVAGFTKDQSPASFEAECNQGGGKILRQGAGAVAGMATLYCDKLPIAVPSMRTAMGLFCSGRLCSVILFSPTLVDLPTRNQQFKDAFDALTERYGKPSRNTFDRVPQGGATACSTQQPVTMAARWEWSDQSRVDLRYYCGLPDAPEGLTINYDWPAAREAAEKAKRIQRENL